MQPTQKLKADPSVSIVIPTFGRAPHLLGLAESIRNATPPSAYEIIAVSSDPSETEKAKWLRAQGDIRVIMADARREGFPRKKSLYFYTNLGIRSAENDWVFVVNDDMSFDIAWYDEFEATVRDCAQSNLGMVIVATHLGDQRLGLRTAVIGRLQKRGGQWKDLHLSDLSIIRRDVLLQIGCFDEKLDWYGSGVDNTLAVEFLTDAGIVVNEKIKIAHAIANEGRQDNPWRAFRDFNYIKRKWNRWCEANHCAFSWEAHVRPYTIRNRVRYFVWRFLHDAAVRRGLSGLMKPEHHRSHG